MTLAQIKKDKRVYSVENVIGDGWDDELTKYELSLEDGYEFDDGGGCNRYRTVAEMSEDLKGVRFVGDEE